MAVTQVTRSAFVIELVAIPSVMGPAVFVGAFGVLDIARATRVLDLLFGLASLALGVSLSPSSFPLRLGLAYENLFFACKGFGCRAFSTIWMMNRERNRAAGIGTADGLEARPVFARTLKDLCGRGDRLQGGE
ncbi:hypothetical protein [Aromatoleum diolicum]|uniref:Uncharacterized protein n=1 Tax=Aromatoleum diolicum TaxID=75796 RepID=A0ABX1QDL4_9RHOO|nr:hypothetical protein [Aromatoleum diolicum]NMG75482.1 hypothetical protein [Aromatoleum diolicum]